MYRNNHSISKERIHRKNYREERNSWNRKGSNYYYRSNSKNKKTMKLIYYEFFFFLIILMESDFIAHKDYVRIQHIKDSLYLTDTDIPHKNGYKVILLLDFYQGYSRI